MKGMILIRTADITANQMLSMPGAGYMTNFNVVAIGDNVEDGEDFRYALYLGTDKYVPDNMTPSAGSEKYSSGTSNGIMFRSTPKFDVVSLPDHHRAILSYGNSKKRIYLSRLQQLHLNIDQFSADEDMLFIIQYDWVPKGMQEFQISWNGAPSDDLDIPKAVMMDMYNCEVDLRIGGIMTAQTTSKVKLFKLAGSTGISNANFEGTFTNVEGSVIKSDTTLDGGEMYLINELITSSGEGNLDGSVTEKFTAKAGKVYRRDMFMIDLDDSDFVGDLQAILTVRGYPMKHEQKADKRYKIEYLTLAEELQII